MKAVAYLRVSGASQIDGTGFERQLETCKVFASALDFEIAETFREEAVSGTLEAVDRPAFLAMVTYLIDSGTKTIIVERLDRLAREYRVQEHLLFYLASKGLTLYNASTAENITEAMMADPMKRFLVQIQGLVAELDKSMTVSKLRKARQITKKRRGHCEGRKPYGFYEGEALILAAMQTLHEAGCTCREIAAQLDSRGHRTRSGGVWRGPTVAKIVRRAAGRVG